jgi:mannonate dehydratase
VHLGTQHIARDDADFRVMAQLGVRHVCADLAGNPHDWTRDDLMRHRAHVESFGLALDMIQLPMGARPVEHQDSPDILTNGPDRDRQIDSICRLIELLAEVGIPAAKYNLNLIGVVRSAPERGRGGSTNTAFRWDRMDQAAPPGRAGVLGEAENWDRIEHFLSRVIPVATANRVRLACHPHDPYCPPGYRGVTRVLGTVDGLKRLVGLHESPCHGLNFCLGSVASMLDDPRREIDAVIRWFGSRGKLMNIHFRNIRGGRLSFMETFPDEGDIDMWQVVRTLRELDYPYMLMPDHVPTVDGADPLHTGFGYCFGYIAGLLQALDATSPPAPAPTEGLAA